jgi:hypothetical protein
MFAPFFIMAIAMLAATSFVFWKRAQKLVRTDYIRTFSLPKGLYNKLLEKHPALSTKDCQLVGRGLRQYFLVYAKSGHRQISMPSQVVDDLWHEFILYTREYDEFCKKAFGQFFHHTPAVVMRSATDSAAGLRRCWRYACIEENINPNKPPRLPLLFAIDSKLNITNGFHYVPDCEGIRREHENNSGGGGGSRSNDGTIVYCAGDFDSSSGADSSSSDGGVDGGGDGGGCGGGGGD